METYRLVRVVAVKPDTKGRVRTVRVAYRQKKAREKEVCSTKLVEEDVGVQRLCLLLPVGGQATPLHKVEGEEGEVELSRELGVGTGQSMTGRKSTDSRRTPRPSSSSSSPPLGSSTVLPPP